MIYLLEAWKKQNTDTSTISKYRRIKKNKILHTKNSTLQFFFKQTTISNYLLYFLDKKTQTNVHYTASFSIQSFTPRTPQIYKFTIFEKYDLNYILLSNDRFFIFF